MYAYRRLNSSDPDKVIYSVVNIDTQDSVGADTLDAALEAAVGCCAEAHNAAVAQIGEER